MPPFEARTLSGNELYSGAYEGRNLVVSFVDAQCKPCDDSLIAAQRMYADNHEVVVVAVVGEEKAGGAANLSRSLGLKFPVIVDKHGSIAKRFEVRAVPRTFVVSKSGRVAWVGGPSMTAASLTAAVRAN